MSESKPALLVLIQWSFTFLLSRAACQDSDEADSRHPVGSPIWMHLSLRDYKNTAGAHKPRYRATFIGALPHSDQVYRETSDVRLKLVSRSRKGWQMNQFDFTDESEAATTIHEHDRDRLAARAVDTETQLLPCQHGRPAGWR